MIFFEFTLFLTLITVYNKQLTKDEEKMGLSVMAILLNSLIGLYFLLLKLDPLATVELLADFYVV
jgi:ABC-type amino acid transport system permease subunit